MMETEIAVTHGTARVHVKDYGKKREAELRRTRHPEPARTGVVNVVGWERLASIFPGPVQRGGDRLMAN